MSTIGKRALLVDDEADARGVLRELLNLFCPEVTDVHEAKNSKESLEVIKAHPFDLVFIDIEIGRESGLELAEHLFTYCPNLIFVTAHDRYAIEAFDTPALHYLLKPVHPKHLRRALGKVFREVQPMKESDRVLLHLREGIFIVKPAELVYVLGDGNYSTFYMRDGRKLIASKHLAHYEELLSEQCFFRTHQSYLVHLARVEQIDTQDGLFAVLDNGDRIPLARRRKEAFIRALTR